MKKRAFVFDDEEAIRHILGVILNARGYEVLDFSDPGLCPLYHATECRCSQDQACGDLIISDINMPNIDGLEFVKRQKEIGCKIENLALMSGAWSAADLECARQLNCTIFHKPFTMEEIEEWLDSCEESINSDRVLTDWFKRAAPQAQTL